MCWGENRLRPSPLAELTAQEVKKEVRCWWAEGGLCCGEKYSKDGVGSAREGRMDFMCFFQKMAQEFDI